MAAWRAGRTRDGPREPEAVGPGLLALAICPPLPEQARIAELPSALDRKISIHVEISTVTSKLRDSLLPLLVSGEGIQPH